MGNKRIHYLYLLVIFFFVLNNNCCAQTAYVKFGATPDCSGTGICTPPTKNQSDLTYTKVKLTAAINPGTQTCNVTMKIYKSFLRRNVTINNPVISTIRQLIDALKSGYQFKTNAPIPISVFNDANLAKFNNAIIPPGAIAVSKNSWLGFGPIIITINNVVLQ